MRLTDETRRESNVALDRVTINKRIISILRDGSMMTAKEVAFMMCQRGYIPYPVRQAVAPRLTELEREGAVEVVGKVYDYETQRHVAAYKLVKP